MQFLFPAFLFALAAIAIPIIIHLFHFRRFKKVYFTNVKFLKEVKEETSARSKLRNLLVLLMRILAIAALVFAFAQPFIPRDDAEVKKGVKAVSIYIDNSFSMQALSQDVALLDKAKQRAREIVTAFAADDEFQIITNDFEGKHQRLVNKDEALDLIEEVNISPAVRHLSKVMARQNQVFNTALTDNHYNYLISDFQRNITDIDALDDTTKNISLIPLQAVQEKNISIDSAWFLNPVPMPNQPNTLVVKLRNYTDEEAENIRLSINYEGQTKPVGTQTIPAQSVALDTVNISIRRTGWHRAELAITDYPIQFDDRYYFTFNVKETIRILSINQLAANAYLDAAFAGIANFDIDNLLSQNLDYSKLGNYQLIVLNGLANVSSGLSAELNKFVNAGGNLLVFPPKTANLDSYRTLLSTFPANEIVRFEDQTREVGQVNTDEFVFNDVFENKSANLKLPVTQGNFIMSSYANRGEERLLTYRDGSSYLSKYKAGSGNLYLCAAPLDDQYNDLVRNGEIFIPMLYKMAIASNKGQKIANTIGQDEVLQADHDVVSQNIVYRLKGEQEEFIPEQRIIGSQAFLGVNDQVKIAGFYDLFLQQDSMLNTYAFNYNRIESQLDYLTPEELSAFVGDGASVIDVTDNAILTAQIEERSQGIVLWRWFLVLALLFLGVETLLLRFWKT